MVVVVLLLFLLVLLLLVVGVVVLEAWREDGSRRGWGWGSTGLTG